MLQVANAVAIAGYTKSLGFIDVFYAKRFQDRDKENAMLKPLNECDFSNVNDMTVSNAKWTRDIRLFFGKLSIHNYSLIFPPPYPQVIRNFSKQFS